MQTVCSAEMAAGKTAKQSLRGAPAGTSQHSFLTSVCPSILSVNEAPTNVMSKSYYIKKRTVNVPNTIGRRLSAIYLLSRKEIKLVNFVLISGVSVHLAPLSRELFSWHGGGSWSIAGP